MTKKVTMIFGVVFLLVGILGLIPGITSDGMLLGIFEVNTTHNIIHLLTGIIALAVMGKEVMASTFLKVFGVVYAIVAIWGFVGDGSILGLFHANLADNILHTVIAVIALGVGFGQRSAMEGESMEAEMPSAPAARVMDAAEPMEASTDMGSDEGENTQA